MCWFPGPMSSLRLVHSLGPALPLLESLRGAVDAETRVILDAAREEFVSHGFRRTAVGDIARRAKVSRPTVYRRLGDKDEIIRAVVIHEVVEFFARVGAGFLGIDDPVERTVETFVAGVTDFRRNPLARAVLKYEPESLVQLVAGDESHSFDLVREALALGLAGGRISEDAARRGAEVILRLTASLLVAPSDLLPLVTAEDARAFATTYLVPIIEASMDPGA